jgi:hypothetical protein
MTAREQRTVRYASIAIAIYLALFFGYTGWNYLARKRAEYTALVTQAQNLKAEVKRYDDKITVVEKLMNTYHMDPTKLDKAAIVAQSSSAIQSAAMSSGFALGPIHESATRTSSKELATIQIEGSGPVKAAIGLLERLRTLGYPLVIDSTQMTADPMRPGQVKLKLTVVILDFDQWKTTEAHHA